MITTICRQVEKAQYVILFGKMFWNSVKIEIK